MKNGETKLDGTFVAPKVKTEKEEKLLPTRSTRTKTLRKNNVEEMEAKKIDEVATATAVRYLLIFYCENATSYKLCT